MSDDIKTVRVDQAQRLSARGDIEPIYRVTFTVGDHGPFTLDFRPADFIPEKVRDAQRAIAATVGAVTS